MAQQTINIGSAPNDGTGDPLRNAFNKANLNFTDLYSGAGVADNSISYSKLSTGFTGIDPVTQSNSFSFNGTDGYSIINVTVSGDLTAGVVGIGVGETRTALVTGGTSLTFGGDTSTYRIIAGEYDPSVVNFIQFFVADGTAGVFVAPQTVYITISQEIV